MWPFKKRNEEEEERPKHRTMTMITMVYDPRARMNRLPRRKNRQQQWPKDDGEEYEQEWCEEEDGRC